MNIEINIENIVLKTDRLVIRPFRITDLDDFYEYAKVEGVGEFAGWKHHQNKEESQLILKKFIEEKKTFAITLDNKVIGSIGIERYNEEWLPELMSFKARELGFVLSKQHWGKGIMKEACEAVIDYCFNVLGMDVLVCGHYDFNDRSKRVQQKLGFIEYKPEEPHYSKIWSKEINGVYSLKFANKETEKRFLAK